MRVGSVEVVVVLLYEIVSINVHLMFDAFFVSFHCISLCCSLYLRLFSKHLLHCLHSFL